MTVTLVLLAISVAVLGFVYHYMKRHAH